MSARTAPARRAAAIPSPVDRGGLVVSANSWPAPPLASTTAPARTRAGRRRPEQGPGDPAVVGDEVDQEGVLELRTDGVARTASVRARSSSAPVASPPAWTTREREWPPSRVRASSRRAHGSESKPAPREQVGDGLAAPRPAYRTATGSHSPAPAARVSATCSATESSTRSSTAAIPPWA